MGVAANREECKTLVITSEPSANGASFYNSDGPGSCYAEFDMTGDNDSPYWQTCYFPGKFINYHLTTLNLQYPNVKTIFSMHR